MRFPPPLGKGLDLHGNVFEMKYVQGDKAGAQQELEVVFFFFTQPFS